MRRILAILAFVLPLSRPAKAWYGKIYRSPQLRCARLHGNLRHTSYPSVRRAVPSCKLQQIPYRDLSRVVPFRPTAENMISSYGQTSAERHRRVLDELALTAMVFWLGYFASRTLLGPLAWMGCSLIILLRVFAEPILEAFCRSSEVWGGKAGRRRTRGALFSGRVTRTGVSLASEASNHRTHFKMLVEDEDGRELLFDAPQLTEHRRVRPGMHCDVVVFSRSGDFVELSGITEAYLPALKLFVGQYPLLNKRAFGDLLREKAARERELGTFPGLSPLRWRKAIAGREGRRRMEWGEPARLSLPAKVMAGEIGSSRKSYRGQSPW